MPEIYFGHISGARDPRPKNSPEIYFGRSKYDKQKNTKLTSRDKKKTSISHKKRNQY